MTGSHSDPLFTAHEHALEQEPCPQCKDGQLSIRHGKHGPFLGCSHYPKCDYIKPLHQNDGHIVKELGVPCPKCKKELLLRQGRYGMFIGCSGYPDCDHIESPDYKEEEPEKRNVIACPECKKGELVERISRFGKAFYACDQYPRCKFAVNQPPVDKACEKCGFSLLVEKKGDDEQTIHQCASRQCQHIQTNQ